MQGMCAWQSLRNSEGNLGNTYIIQNPRLKSFQQFRENFVQKSTPHSMERMDLSS